MIGRTVSHYLVLETIGGGSMGVVYKAKDLQLDRPVALKVLRPEKVADPRRRAWFVREAKAASALNHPNIITIHEIGETEGVHFMCMEWVRGTTLADLIRRRTLTLDLALTYAIQIASALATAHAAGIIHRDLSPANIMVTEEGQVKVLDFGLAKLAPVPQPGESDETMEMKLGGDSEDGLIVGTPAYMSPEQAHGEKLDSRSDIFSFGAVLYVMITGQDAFMDVSPASTVASILRDDPPPASSIVPSLPREIDRTISVCLRKDVRRRFQHMEDVHAALLDLKEELDAGRLAQGPFKTLSVTAVAKARRKQGTRRWMFYAAAGALLAVAASANIWWLMRAKAPATAGGLTRLTWDLGVSTDPTLSPNARLLAYASDRSGEGNLDIWVRHASGGEAIRLTRNQADDRDPAFSPDSSRIAFRSERDQGGIYVVPALGGAERLVARLGRRPRFSPDGAWIAYWVRDPETNWGKLYIVPASGGAARPVRPEFPDAHSPIWSADGKRLLFCGTSEIKPPSLDVHDWWIADLERGSVARTGAFAVFRRQGLPPNHLPGGWFGDRVVFASRVGDSRNLWQARFSRNGQIAGNPERLTLGTGAETRPFVTAEGYVVFASGTSNTGIWRLPIHGRTGSAAGTADPLVHAAGASNTKPSLAEDGSTCAFVSDRDGHDEIYTQGLESGKEIALTATSPEELAASHALGYGLQPDWPVVTRDGSRVAYFVLQAPSMPLPEGMRKQAIYTIPASGGTPEKICDNCGRPTGWSADGRQLLFESPQPRTPIYVLDLASGSQKELLRHPAYSFHEARFSPDDRWIAFRANVGQGRMRVYVAPYKDSPAADSEWIQVTDGQTGGSVPRWSPDGNLLYFFSNLDGLPCIRARHLAPGTKRPTGESFVVYRFADARHPPAARFLFSVSRDKMVFSLDELTSNVWMVKLPGQNSP